MSVAGSSDAPRRSLSRTTLLDRGGEASLSAMGPTRRILYRGQRAVLEGLCRVYVRLEVRGRERLPVAGPFILSPVHRSNIDFAITGAAIPRVMRFMAKDSIWKVRVAGWYFEQMGAFPVDRDRPDRTALRRCEDALANGDPVVMFPEGRRRSGAVVEDVLEGPAWVACRNRVPIVPVGLGGTDRAMRIGSRMILPRKVRVVIGEPIYPDVPLTGRVPHRLVSELTDRLRGELQSCYDQVR